MWRGPLFPALCGLSVALTAGCGTDAGTESVSAMNASLPGAASLTVLHLGDSHTAADHFSGHLRSLFQERFGRGPRGMLPPGAIYKGYSPHQVKLQSEGGWRLFDAWRHPDEGPYGVSGYRLTGARPEARLTYEVAEGDGFTQVSLGTYGGPETGSLVLGVEGGDTHVIRTRSEKPGYALKTIRLDREVTRITLAPEGDGKVTMLSVWLGRPGASGVTYVSHGVPGATVGLLARMDETILKQEIAALDPALVILAFGTNEGFNDALDAVAYGRLFTEQVRRIETLAPGARIAIAGPPDANRLSKRGRGRGAATRPRPCLTEPQEARSGGARDHSYWSVPGMLEKVREVQRGIARTRGLDFWDWSSVMGGKCGMHGWANAVPPRAFADHVHMTDEGAAESAHRFFGALMTSGAGGWSLPAPGMEEDRPQGRDGRQ